MLNVNWVLIDEVNNKINVKITGNFLTAISIGSCGLDSGKFKDISFLIPPTVTNIYEFDILPADVGIDNFNGLFFLVFTSEQYFVDCCGNSVNNRLAIAGNFAKYHECLLNKTLQIDFDGCSKKEPNCESCDDSIYYISSLISSLYTAVKLRRYKSACKIIKLLNSFCDVCNSCPSYYNEILDEDSDFFTPIFDYIDSEGISCSPSSRPGCQPDNINIGGGYGFATLNNIITQV